MPQNAQSQMEYLLAIVAAFIISIVVLFVIFNITGQVRASITGESIVSAEAPVSLPIKDEFKVGFISGMVSLYLLECLVFLTFYHFIASRRYDPEGERVRADKIFKEEKQFV